LACPRTTGPVFINGAKQATFVAFIEAFDPDDVGWTTLDHLDSQPVTSLEPM
jgi:hypothetical protein